MIRISQCSSAIQRAKQVNGRDLNDTRSRERGRTRGDGERTRWLAGSAHSPWRRVGIRTLSSQFQTRSTLSTKPLHKSTTRAGALVTSTTLSWVEGHTGGTRSIPTVHTCSQNGRRLWIARKHHFQTSPMRTHHTRNYHLVAEHVPRSTARQGAGELRIEEVCLRVDL